MLPRAGWADIGRSPYLGRPPRKNRDSSRFAGPAARRGFLVSREQGAVASLADTTPLFALLGMGIADAVATPWWDQYHTSGSSTFAGAASTVLAGFYCRDSVPYSFTGEQPGTSGRSYTGFAEAAREAGYEIGKEITRTRLLASGVRSNCK